MLDRIALILVIIGGINWGSIGLFKFDIVGWICGGQDAVISRIIYTLVALAAVWCISLLFKQNEILSSDNGEKEHKLKVRLSRTFFCNLCFICNDVNHIVCVIHDFTG